MAANVPAGKGGVAPSSASAAGLALSSLTAETKKTYNVADALSSGAVITKVDPDSDAAEKGLQAGDVVLKIGNRTVRSPADFQSGVTDAKKGGRTSVLLLVARSQGGTSFVAIDVEKS